MGVLQGLAQYGEYLYAAWKGDPGDERIFYSYRGANGIWESASPMASATVAGNTSAGPSLAACNGSLYVAWKGEWSDPRIFFASFNGGEWVNQRQIPNAYSDTGPALCQVPTSSQLLAVWKGFDQNLYYAIYSGTQWTTPSQIPGVGSSVGPSLAAYGDTVYAVWKGAGSDELWYASFDGSTWSGQTQIPGVASSVGASLAKYGLYLYAVWKGAGSDDLWYARFNGKAWSGQAQGSSQTLVELNGGPDSAQSSMGAAIAEYGLNLYAMWKGAGSDHSLYNAYFDGATWSAQTNDISGNTGPDPLTLLPAPTGGGNNNYVLADSKGAELTGLTVTIIVAQDIVSVRRSDGSYRYGFEINCEGAGYGGDLPPQPDGEKFAWQQFFFDVDTDVNGENATLSWWVNCFPQQDLSNNIFFWVARTKLWALPSSDLKQGWQLTMTLSTDQSNNVTGVTFSAVQPDGAAIDPVWFPLTSLLNPTTGGPNAGSANFAPIFNVQTILSGEFNGQVADFKSGEGFILSYAPNNLTATAPADESGENSNINYSALPASYPNGEFYQFFSAP
jgi:hypothetical protein